MATAIGLRFPLGRYHGTPWGRNVNEGSVDWPPEPWRLLRALVATWRCRAPELDEAHVLQVLDALAAAPAYALPPVALAHTRHYYPNNKAGTDKVFDGFAAVDATAEAVVVFPVELSPDHRDALGRLCELLPYLGRADSVCEARLLSDEEAESLPTEALLEVIDEDDGDALADSVEVLAAQTPLDYESLVARTTTIRKGRRIDPPGSVRLRYPRISSPRRTPRPQPRPTPVVGVRFALTSPALPSRHAAVAVGDALRRAAMSRYGDLNDGGASSQLAGKDVGGTPLRDHRHAHYLPWASTMSDADGRLIDTVVVWCPAGLDARDVTALTRVTELRGRSFVRDFSPCRLGLEAVGAVELIAPELCGPSRRWASFTPFAPPRHGRRNRPWEEHVVGEVRRELEARGFSPESIELRPGGWLDFRRYRLTERLEDARRAIGVQITFDEAVVGPLAIGALSHFGLGLLRPAS